MLSITPHKTGHKNLDVKMTITGKQHCDSISRCKVGSSISLLNLLLFPVAIINLTSPLCLVYSLRCCDVMSDQDFFVTFSLLMMNPSNTRSTRPCFHDTSITLQTLTKLECCTLKQEGWMWSWHSAATKPMCCYYTKMFDAGVFDRE